MNNAGVSRSITVPTREARARRAARKAGTTLRKYRGRDEISELHGTYMLVDPGSGAMIIGNSETGFGMALEEIEAYLCLDDASRQIASEETRRQIADAFGAKSCSFGNHVPAMQPGDYDVVEADDQFETRITLLDKGMACRTVVRYATGEVFGAEVFAVPEGYGEMGFALGR